jgi:serine/threonine protein kinase
VFDALCVHDLCAQLYDALENDEYVYVITEYCAHGDMRKYLERFGPLAESLGGYSVRASISPRAAAQVIEQCMRGTQYLHEHNVIHRDLSTGNVLIAAVQPQFLVVSIQILLISLCALTFRKLAILDWQRSIPAVPHTKLCAVRRILCHRECCQSSVRVIKYVLQ